MNKLVLFALLLFCCSAVAQRTVDVDKLEGSALAFFSTAGGVPVLSAKFVRLVEGTPYFTDQWLKGKVLIGRSEYRNLILRINILETSLEFRDIKGEAMVCSMPVEQVVLNDSLTGAQYSFAHSSFLPENPDLKRLAWLQLLNAGQAGLYKLSKKQIHEDRPYGSAITEQRISNLNSYYLLFNKQWTRIKKTSDVAEVLSSKKQHLLDYIKKNHLNDKEEKDMIELIIYYNTL